MPRFKFILTPLSNRTSTLPPLPSPLRITPAHYSTSLHPQSAIEPRARHVPPHLALSKREKAIIGTPLTLLPRTPTRHSTFTPTTPSFEILFTPGGTPISRSPTTVKRRLVRKKGSRSLILESLETPNTPITPDMVDKVNKFAELERLTKEVWKIEKAKVVRMDKPIGPIKMVEIGRVGHGLGIRGVALPVAA